MVPVFEQIPVATGCQGTSKGTPILVLNICNVMGHGNSKLVRLIFHSKDR